MDRKEATELLRGYLENYLTDKGINTRKPFRCLNPDHEDRHPSMSFHKRGNHVKCFSCEASYNIFDLIGIDYGLLDFKEQVDKACELYGIDIDGYQYKGIHAATRPQNRQRGPKLIKEDESHTKEKEGHILANKRTIEYLEECHERVKETEYFHQRGLNDEIIDRFKLGYDPSNGSVVIPTGNSYNARILKPVSDKPKYMKPKGVSADLFNIEALQQDDVVFITEGEIDAMSIIMSGHEAVGLGSTSGKTKLLEYIEKQGTNAFLVLSLDNDGAGRKTTEDLEEKLTSLEIAFTTSNISIEAKDPNEALTSNKDLFMEMVNGAYADAIAEKESKIYDYIETNSAGGHIKDFLGEINERANTAAIPTGFSRLDKILDDGLYEGLYTIGAISSLGKTTFVLQIADNIARSGQDVLIFSLEMARSELMAKSISRHTFDNKVSEPKTARGITAGNRYKNYSNAEKEAINKAIRQYQEYADHLFIIEGIGNIGTVQVKRAVKNHFELTGNKPVVIIDYIQILAPYEPRGTDKQNIDKAVLELKRLSRDYKIPVIAISSFNRASYNGGVKMEAFKESGSLEYSSDIVIGLQFRGQKEAENKTSKSKFDIDEAKSKNPREVQAKILKNRQGKTGDTINYQYTAKFNSFKEVFHP